MLRDTDLQPVFFAGIKDKDGSLLNVSTRKFIRHGNAIVRYCRLFPAIPNKPGSIVYVNEVFSLRFTVIPLLFSRNMNAVLAPRGSLHERAVRHKYLLKKSYLFFLKTLIKHRKVCFHASSNDEANDIKKTFGLRSIVSIIPNIPAPVTRRSALKGAEMKLITIARISFIKSIAETLQALKNCTTSISYTLYGFNDEKKYWNDCLQLISKLPDNIRFTYSGPLKQSDLQKVLDNADVYIQVSRAENFGHSLVNALNAGLPVITGKDMPWKNLEQHKAGLNVDIESNKIASAIEFFSEMSAWEFSKWQQGATDYYNKYINDTSLKHRYLQMFQYPKS